MLKPRLKPSHSVHRSPSGNISIGEVGSSSYFVREAPESFLDLLLLLDGSSTIPRIARFLQRKHPEISDNEIKETIGQLQEANLLDDGALRSSVLSSEEIERYDRQMVQFSAVETQSLPGFNYQEKLKQSTICILGMGGWGTWISMNLALAGTGRLRFVDADYVEHSNLNRQVLFDNSSIGLQKVDAARSVIERINPHVDVEVVDEFVERDRAQIERILDGVSFVCLCWANQSAFVQNTAEDMVHQVCRERKIPIIELAGDPFDIAVGPLYPNDGSSPCLECVKPQYREKWWGGDELTTEFRKRTTKSKAYRKVNAWQSAPSLSIISGLATNEIVNAITGYIEPGLAGKRLSISLLNAYQTEMESFSFRDDCSCRV